MDENIMSMFKGSGDDNENGSNLLAGLLPVILPGLIKSVLGDPEMIKEVIHNTVTQYKPVVYAVLNELLTAYEDLANNKKVATAHATMKRNSYQAYIDAGFTDEQAMVFLVDAAASSQRLIANLTGQVTRSARSVSTS